MSYERDYSNDYEDWLYNTGGAGTGSGQGKPENPALAADPYLPVQPSPAAGPAPSVGGGGATGGGKTPEQIEAEGRAYDAQHGYVGGYMMNGVWVNGSPTSSTGGSIRSGEGMNTGGYLDFGMSRPDYSMLPFSPYEGMPEFAAPQFTPSSWTDAENEPGYKASRTNLRKQIEAGAAYKGMVRSGMTIGDLYSNLDALGQQNFKQFDDRRFRNFQSDYTGARDKYSFASTENARKNQYQFNTQKASFDDALSRWEEQVRSLTSLARPVE